MSCSRVPADLGGHRNTPVLAGSCRRSPRGHQVTRRRRIRRKAVYLGRRRRASCAVDRCSSPARWFPVSDPKSRGGSPLIVVRPGERARAHGCLGSSGRRPAAPRRGIVTHMQEGITEEAGDRTSSMRWAAQLGRPWKRQVDDRRERRAGRAPQQRKRFRRSRRRPCIAGCPTEPHRRGTPMLIALAPSGRSASATGYASGVGTQQDPRVSCARWVALTGPRADNSPADEPAVKALRRRHFSCGVASQRPITSVAANRSTRGTASALPVSRSAAEGSQPVTCRAATSSRALGLVDCRAFVVPYSARPECLPEPGIACAPPNSWRGPAR